MDNADLWAMLVLSTWSLGPATSGHFIDSWLLSGSTMLYSLLSYGFSSHGSTESFDSQDQMTKDRILAWNASALVHLKSVLKRDAIKIRTDCIRFSVGTGKPSVFATDILSQFTAIVQESVSSNSDDKISAIELELYASLYRCVVQQAVQFGQTKAHFHAWTAKHEKRQYAHLN